MDWIQLLAFILLNRYCTNNWIALNNIPKELIKHEKRPNKGMISNKYTLN